MIRYYGDEILKQKCEEITEFNAETKAICDELEQEFLKSQGIGLAAPQIGYNKRICIVARVERMGKGYEVTGYMPFVNPEIVEVSKRHDEDWEGCLSYPGLYVPVSRAKKIMVEFSDPEGNRMRIELEDMEARIAQHEIDHLDGITMLEKLSPVDRIKAGQGVTKCRKLIEEMRAKDEGTDS